MYIIYINIIYIYIRHINIIYIYILDHKNERVSVWGRDYVRASEQYLHNQD